MEIMKTAATILIKAALCCFLGLLATTSRAADKNDPTGTWKWSFTTQNGDTRESTLNLKLDGDKLTGKMSGRNGNDTEIENGKVKDDQISFDVTRERNGNKFTTKYNGKISGDTITGKIETENNGQARSRDWNAKREGSSSKSDNSSKNFTGDWKYTINTPNGQSLEPVLKLKQDGDKLSGIRVMGDREAPISDAKIDGNKATFTVESERNGTKVTSKYDAKLEDGSLKGKITSNFGGTDRTYDFEAKKQ